MQQVNHFAKQKENTSRKKTMQAAKFSFKIQIFVSKCSKTRLRSKLCSKQASLKTLYSSSQLTLFKSDSKTG